MEDTCAYYSEIQQKSAGLLNKIEKIDPEIYRSFLSAIEHYRSGKLGAHDLINGVRLILSGHEDWLKEFSLFLQEPSNKDEEEDHQRGRRQLLEMKRAADFVNKILTLSERYGCNIFHEVVEEVWRFKKRGSSCGGTDDGQAALIDRLDKIFFNLDEKLHKEFRMILLDSNLKPPPKRHNRRSIPTHEINLSICKSVTESYWVHPPPPGVVLSENISPNVEILNNRYFSRGSFDPSRHATSKKRRSCEETVMLQRDEDMFEAEMLLETLKAAIDHAEDVLMIIPMKKDVEEIIMLETRPPRFNELIRKLYKHRGEEVLQILKKNPRRALQVMLVSFEKKKLELMEAIEDWKESWRSIISGN